MPTFDVTYAASGNRFTVTLDDVTKPFITVGVNTVWVETTSTVTVIDSTTGISSTPTIRCLYNGRPQNASATNRLSFKSFQLHLGAIYSK